MKNATRIQTMAAFLAAAGMCLPQIALGAPPTGGQPADDARVISDVQLHQDGVLYGQVVTPENQAVAGVDVALHSGGKQLAVGKTDQDGRFAFSGLRRGVYQVASGNGHGAYRAWNPGAAPPAAKPTALIVTGTETVRGQNGMRRFRDFMSNPLVIAGIVAAAVAIPVAIHNSNKKPSST